MAIHDWTGVGVGIFHDFHHGLIADLAKALNRGVLPASHYALIERRLDDAQRDVLRPPARRGEVDLELASSVWPPAMPGRQAALPKQRPTAESEAAFYRRKQSRITIRHAGDDDAIAVIEIVSPADKASRRGVRRLVENMTELLDGGIHLLIVDLLPPGAHDPNGICAVIWDDIAGQACAPRVGKPLTVAAFESTTSVRAYVEPLEVGDAMPEMPLFLQYNGCVQAPLEDTYQAAFEAVPRRWRRVLEGA